jgi:O-acetyl-ADP-ribose deacetylase (regulator of RNase III)
LQFKNAWPENFKAYEAACLREEVQPGRMFVFETGHLTNPRYIINFPTKRHWRGKSRIQDIESGLTALVAEIRKRGITSVAIPPLGSGLGGLSGMTYAHALRLHWLFARRARPHSSPREHPKPTGCSTNAKSRR